MKAYVIKDGMFYARGETKWTVELPFASIFNKKEDAEKLKNKIKKKFENYNTQVITLTIYEGDPLELACEETDNYWNEQKAFAKKMPLYDYFIQQAKESEKDGV